MKVIVDNKIPYIAGEIEKIADKVVYLPGDAFTQEEVKEADALVVRTRTHCNRDLLEGSQVKFIVTATIGFDHIDTEYCHEAGIAWTNCPGCNAGSVEQYIHSVLLLLKREKGVKLEETTLGIVGVGHVGSRVKRMAESLGMKVLLNDPPRADKGEKGFVDLRTIASESDVITFHTPRISDNVNESAIGVSDIAAKTTDVVSLTAETFDRSMNCKQLAENLRDITAKFQINE